MRNISAFLCLACTLTAAWGANFPALLDELEKASTPMLRGFDQSIRAFDHPGNRVVGMIGSAETWDAYGTQALRDAVLARWRKRWMEEGERMLRGIAKPAPLKGKVEMQAVGMLIRRDTENVRTPFFLNNRHLYVMGTMDGRFPPMAFMLGDQSGVWAPPWKALDGFRVLVRESGAEPWALTDSTRFTHDFASASFTFTNGTWKAERLDFPAKDKPALISRLTLENTTDRPRTVEIDFEARVNVRPDWRTTAHNQKRNDLDHIESADGLVRAWDANLPRSLILVGAEPRADDIRIAAPTATLTHRVQVPPLARVTLTYAVLAGMDAAAADSTLAFHELVTSADAELKAARSQSEAGIAHGVSFSCSDPKLVDAFKLAKANLALLTAEGRPHFPDRYLMAGVPMYPRLFACDSCISVRGAMAAGFMSEAAGTLNCLASQAAAHGSLVPHESASDATQIGPSNAQETPQFIAACAHHLRWSGDMDFAKRHFPLLKAAFDAQRQKFDSNGNGYPQGPALIETKGMGPEKLDAACWVHAALQALAEVAAMLGASDDAAKYTQEALTLRQALQRDWWLPQQSIWADSLDAAQHPRQDGLWSVVFPLLTGVADEAQARHTLDALARGWVNAWGGVHTRKDDISQHGSGVVTTALFANAAFAHGQPDFGLRLLQMAAEAPLQDRMPGGFTEMIPPGGSSPVQLWSAGPFLEGIIEGLAGVRPDAAHQSVDIYTHLPAGMLMNNPRWLCGSSVNSLVPVRLTGLLCFQPLALVAQDLGNGVDEEVIFGADVFRELIPGKEAILFACRFVDLFCPAPAAHEPVGAPAAVFHDAQCD